MGRQGDGGLNGRPIIHPQPQVSLTCVLGISIWMSSGHLKLNIYEAKPGIPLSSPKAALLLQQPSPSQ